MSQHDFDIANASGAAVRADLNNALTALASLSSGTTAPSTTYAYQWWFDTTANILKIRDGANTAWVNGFSLVGTTWIPYRSGTLLGDAAVRTIGTSGATVPLLNGANTFSGISTFSAQLREAKGADVASASPLVLGTDGNYFDVTGTTGFSAITVAAGTLFMLQFDGVLTMTDGASLDLGGANITTAAGDHFIGFAVAADTVQMVSYHRATGQPLAGGANIIGPTTLSGATELVTGLTGARHIEIVLNGVSGSGTDTLELTLGDSGGIETTGYLGSGVRSSTIYPHPSDAFRLVSESAAADLHYGVIELFRGDDTNHDWVEKSMLANAAASQRVHISGGAKSLSATLDRFQLQWSGADTFDAGEVTTFWRT